MFSYLLPPASGLETQKQTCQVGFPLCQATGSGHHVFSSPSRTHAKVSGIDPNAHRMFSCNSLLTQRMLSQVNQIIDLYTPTLNHS